MKKLLLIALSTFAISAQAWEPTYYVGGSLGSPIFNSTTYRANFHVLTLEGVGGAVLLPYLAVEARLGVGLGEGNEDVFVGYAVNDTGDYLNIFGEITTDPLEFVQVKETMDVEINYYASAYLRPFVANEKATLYGLLGFSSFGLDSSEPGMLENTSESGLSYGLGCSFTMNEHLEITAEWKKMLNADDFDIAGGTVGFTYAF